VPLRDLEEPAELSEEWHTEANIQASLVTALAAGGWRILSVANTATKARGIDVIASRDAQTVGVEVKGFPAAGTPTRPAAVRPSGQARARRRATGTRRQC
jgi:Holliday junction resolvase-like predicted endonuclease